MNISKEYLAGLLDGEGYFGLMTRRVKTHDGYQQQGHTPTVKMAFTTRDAQILYELHKKYGGYIYHKKAHKTSLSAIQWELKTKSKLIEFLPKIIPYLILKKEQAEILLEYCKLGNVHPKYKTYAENKKKTDEIFNRLKVLKGKLPATTE